MKKLWNTIKTILSMAKEIEAIKAQLEGMQSDFEYLDDYISSQKLEDFKSDFESLKKSHDKLDRSVDILFSNRV